MKFHVFSKAVPRVWLPPKLLLVMKLTTFLLLITFLQVSAKGLGQRITLNETNAPLKKVIQAIELQSGYVFFYDSKDVRQKVNIHVSNATIEDALAECFRNLPLSYKIADKTILLQQKELPVIAEIPVALIDVKGQVTDSKGTPLAGANVTAQKAKKTVVTDANGRFEMKDISYDETLVISYTGYVSQKIAANSSRINSVVLEEDVKALSGVVVVGYGTQKKVNLTGAVSQVSGEDIGYHATPSITNSLQGLIPGLNIQANSGNPSEKPDINIRGFNSVNGGSPLILIDGIQGDIERVNPLDVETVTVLKDAASAAIYGARGAFGVILITTKKGKSGNLAVNYTNNFGRTTPIVRTDYISDPYQYGKIVDAFLSGYNGTTYTNYTDADYAKEKQVAEGTLAPFNEKQADGTYKFFGKTNWYDMIFRQWQPSQTHNLSISGGNDKIQGYLSGRAYKVGTIQANVDANLIKYNIKGNLNFKPTKWLEIGENIQVSTADMTEYGGSKAGYVTSTGIYNGNTYYFLFPFMPSEINGIPYDYNGYGEVAALGDKSSFQKTYTEQFVNTISGKLTPVKDLVFNIDYSNTVNHAAITTRENPITYLTTLRANLQTVGVNSLAEARNRNYYNALNVYGTYNKSLFHDSHHFKLLLGYNQENYRSDNVTAQQGNLLVSNLSSLNLGTNLLQATGSGSVWAIRGFFGRFNYDYQNKYLLEVNGRYDGSSRFPESSRYGFFPSVSAGWYVSKENFFKPLKNVISSFKLRGSYGQLGNQNIDLYTFSQILSTGQTYWALNAVRMNQVTAPSPLPSVVTWETSKTVDVGADIGLLNDHINISFDYYEKNISGMYVPGQPLPSVFGASEPKENIASLRDRGFELQVGYNGSFDVLNSPFHLKTTLNLSNFVGEITKYPNASGLMSSFYEGQKLGDIYGYHIDGQFQSDKDAAAYQASFVNPATSLGQVYNYEINIVQNAQWKGLHAGDIKYVDVNGDGAINKGKNTLADHGDLVKIGNVMPKLPFGFNLIADWKNVDLIIATAGVMHQDWYPTGNIFWGPYERPYLSFIRKDLIENAWTPETPNNKYPQAVRGYASLGSLRSLGEINDYYLTNVGYLRVKNLTIGYTLPAKLTQRASIQKLRVYFSGENLFTWSFGHLTKYIDPETAGSGIDYSTPMNVATGSGSVARAGESYPLGKVYSFGLSITL
ncbi:TonB-dependent receptor [Pinibacter soli]|uniref:TonB-dependent receptor n=1 Tax=Pinibacter soli TaxID=3044211 RepID=A0ABT6RA56_9BACT|nr:TonB-dependent receptor [Pinibacter soli]MDI3319451.1 TonB-dependent receptor [Pinibacter soli]